MPSDQIDNVPALEQIRGSKPFSEITSEDLATIEKSKTETHAEFQKRCDDATASVPESKKGAEITFEELQVIERSKTVLPKLPERLAEHKERIQAESKKLRNDKHLDSYEFFDNIMKFDYTLIDLPDLVYLKFKIEAAMAKMVGYKETPCDNSKD